MNITNIIFYFNIIYIIFNYYIVYRKYENTIKRIIKVRIFIIDKPFNISEIIITINTFLSFSKNISSL